MLRVIPLPSMPIWVWARGASLQLPLRRGRFGPVAYVRDIEIYVIGRRVVVRYADINIDLRRPARGRATSSVPDKKRQAMKSVNFEFLCNDWSDLAALGGFAETYAHTDPQSALVKLRTYAERMVGGIYRRLGLPSLPQSNLIELLQNAAFREATPKVVQGKFHALRIHGNKAAHGEKVTQDTAL